MVITEEHVPDDQIEIRPNGVIQVREATYLVRDGVRDANHAPRYHRYVLMPGDDLTGKPEMVVAVAEAVWTKQMKRPIVLTSADLSIIFTGNS